jgi:hypothetical protein
MGLMKGLRMHSLPLTHGLARFDIVAQPDGACHHRHVAA